MDNAEKRRLASKNPDSYDETPWLTEKGKQKFGYSTVAPLSQQAVLDFASQKAQQAAQQATAKLIAQQTAQAAKQASDAAEAQRQSQIKAQAEAGRQSQLQGESLAKQSLSGMNVAQQDQNKAIISSQPSGASSSGGGFDVNQTRQASLQQFGAGTPLSNQGAGGTQRPSNTYNLPTISGLTFGGA